MEIFILIFIPINYKVYTFKLCFVLFYEFNYSIGYRKYMSDFRCIQFSPILNAHLSHSFLLRKLFELFVIII